MKKITLAQALKFKNRTVGELNRLQKIFTRENARRSDSKSKTDRADIFNKINIMSLLLTAIKTKIAAANTPIFGLIERMSQEKAAIVFLKSVPARETDEKVAIGYSKEVEVYQWDSYMNQESLENEVQRRENIIANMQDRLDAFNATTSIEFEEASDVVSKDAATGDPSPAE